jgi:putative ABC transport system permease protein
MALISDFRAAFRALAAHRTFTVIAVLTLAAGFALAASILTVVNAYVVRALPYPEADRLYRVDYAPAGQPWPRGMEQLDWSSLDDVLELTIAWDLDVFYLLGRRYPESAPGAWVSPGYLSGLGIRAALGRALTTDDFRPGTAPVAMISHRLWQSRFAADPDIVGQTFDAYVSDRPEEPESFTIVGVLPSNLWHLNVYTEVLTPLKAPSFPYQVRLRPGVSSSVAVDRIDTFIRNSLSALPPHYRVSLTSVHESYVTQIRPVLWSVVAGTVLVLLIAAANVAVLMIVRARKRERELAIRLALGAGRMRVARLVALEGALVAASSMVLGLITARIVIPSFAPVLERSLDRRVPGGLEMLSLDASVLAAMAACGIGVTLVLAAIPVVMMWRGRGAMTVAGSARGATEQGAGHARAVLIGVEIAASLTLLAGAALMTESALRMLVVDFGVEADRVVTAGLAVRQRSFPAVSDRADLYTRLERELEQLPGGSSVALGDWWPLQGSRPRRVETGGSAPATATANPFAVSPRYFDTLGIRLLEGRTFTAQDRFGSAAVVVISAALAARLWPGAQAVGQHLTIDGDGDEPSVTATIVGVVSDVRQSHADDDLLDAYLPLAQHASRFAFVYLRGAATPSSESSLREAVARVHPEVAVGVPRLLADGIEQERARPRFLAYLLSTFAIFASAVAVVGMHGVIAYAVGQRQREIAVRMAVGADPRTVIMMFLQYGVVVLIAGIGAGLAGAFGLGRILQSQLHGVQGWEPRVLAAVTLLFSASALTAVWWPAWRAASLDPVSILKDE